jgi:hypothetical protein
MREHRRCAVPDCPEHAGQRVFMLDGTEQVTYLCSAHFTEFMKEANTSQKSNNRPWVAEWLQQLQLKGANK